MATAPGPPPGEEGGEELDELNELLQGDWVGPPSPAVDAPGGRGSVGPPPVSVSVVSPALGSDAEQGSMLGTAAPPRTRTRAPPWSLMLSRPVWDYLSRLEFYEDDESLPSRERLFHHWWLSRRLAVARALCFIFFFISAPAAGIYIYISCSFKVRLFSFLFCLYGYPFTGGALTLEEGP